MSIEELKLILDTINSLGIAGKEVFIWWLIAQYGSYLLTVWGFFSIAIWGIWLIYKASRQSYTSLVKHLANKLGVYHNESAVIAAIERLCK